MYPAMHNFKYILSLVLTIALISACNPATLKQDENSQLAPGIKSAREASFPDMPFKEALRSGYIALADYEWTHKNKNAAKVFSKKAMTTLTNLDPDTEGLYDRDLDLRDLNDLLGAKYFIDSAFVAGLKEKDPQTAAKAQLMFDCWVEQLTRGHTKEDTRPCKAEFDKSRQTVIAFMDETNKRNEAQKKNLDAKLSSMQRVNDLHKMPDPSLIFFQFNSAELGVTAKGIIAKVAEDIRKFKPKKVVIAGNTDLVGTYQVNMILAMKRGQKVADYMIKHYGTDGSLLDVKAYGFNNPMVDPTVKKKEVRNRYVKIIFLKDSKTYYQDNNDSE
ncbi:MAG: OmpA/MotB [Rickettsiaceae bacterium]|jgi:outer membrane protein OmpA-like peptidoglycan-associated protein|nr:OmpA/MotB [Rickettsiaceae bacterium]